MNKVFLVGNINNNNEIKMSNNNNLEIIEFNIDDIKVKGFGKLAVKAKDLSGLVYAEGTISVRDYTNKDGKTYPIQDIAINKIESLMQVSEKEEAKAIAQNSINTWESAKDMEINPDDYFNKNEIDPEELPFY